MLVLYFCRLQQNCLFKIFLRSGVKCKIETFYSAHVFPATRRDPQKTQIYICRIKISDYNFRVSFTCNFLTLLKHQNFNNLTFFIYQISFVSQLTSWQSCYASFEFTVKEASFINKQWKNLFRPCASLRLIVHVSIQFYHFHLI